MDEVEYYNDDLDKIKRMEERIKVMRAKMYAMPVNSRMREEAGKAIRHCERDLEVMRRNRGQNQKAESESDK